MCRSFIIIRMCSSLIKFECIFVSWWPCAYTHYIPELLSLLFLVCLFHHFHVHLVSCSNDSRGEGKMQHVNQNICLFCLRSRQMNMKQSECLWYEMFVHVKWISKYKWLLSSFLITFHTEIILFSFINMILLDFVFVSVFLTWKETLVRFFEFSFTKWIWMNPIGF